MYVIKICGNLKPKELEDLYMVYKQMIQDEVTIVYPGVELYMVDEKNGNCIKVG